MKHSLQILPESSALLQSRGAMVGIALQTDRVSFASENAHSYFKKASFEDLLAQKATKLLGPDVVHAVRNCAGQIAHSSRRHLLGTFQLENRDLSLSVFGASGDVVIELTDSPAEDAPTALTALRDYESLIDLVQSSKTCQEMLERTVRFLRVLSGFQTVSICKYGGEFDCQRVSAGQVVDIIFPWKGHTKYCLVEDISAPKQRLVLADNQVMPNLELSSFYLPSLSALESVKAMGFTAIHLRQITKDGSPWAYLQMLHNSPRIPNMRTELLLQHFLPFLDQKLAVLDTC